MSIRRFCRRLGIPESTYYYWRSVTLSGREPRRWPAPVVDAIEEEAAEKAHAYSAWGHRKIWELLRRDGTMVSPESVKRALKRRGLLQPARYQAERRNMAKARRATFDAPPMRRNRVWQTDFSEFETTNAGVWRITGVVDYAAKLCLACQVKGTQKGLDAVSIIEAAIHEAEELLGKPLKEDLVDPATGEIATLAIVTDNGPAYKSDRFARFIMSRPELRHVRTRHHSPQTNGVIERFFETIKYEHLYRLEIVNAWMLTEEIESFRQLFNEIRPHEALGMATPLERYMASPEL
jgi:transposase InsO family protein